MPSALSEVFDRLRSTAGVISAPCLRMLSSDVDDCCRIGGRDGCLLSLRAELRWRCDPSAKDLIHTTSSCPISLWNFTSSKPDTAVRLSSCESTTSHKNRHHRLPERLRPRAPRSTCLRPALSSPTCSLLVFSAGLVARRPHLFVGIPGRS